MDTLEKIKSKLFKAVLTSDLREWSLEALEDLRLQVGGLDIPAITLFKGEADIALREFNSFCDHLILQELTEKSSETARTHEKVEKALALKFALFHESQSVTLAIVKYLSHPLRLRLALDLQWQTLNKIWYYAGDRATDFNYYSKRALLGYIYKTTFIFWLRHRHQDLDDTLSFMKKRFKDVALIPQAKNFLKEKVLFMKSMILKRSP